jgi:hypothetical protein
MKYATPQVRAAAARLFARDASVALDARGDLAAEAAGLLDTPVDLEELAAIVAALVGIGKK